MPSANEHIRKTFLTGVFAAIPLAVTIFIIYWINDKTKPITIWLFRHDIPFLGVVIALAVIYFVGMIANSLIGRFFLRRVDRVLGHIPMVREIYLGWKQIALTPGGTEGTFSRVVTVPDETGRMKYLGFCSGRIVEGAEPMFCVFVPNSPNPITGRLYFVPVNQCHFLQLSVEEAFKVILSAGNYVPPLTGEKQLMGEKT